MFSSWAIETVLTWWSDSTISLYFIPIFNNWPSRAWCSFDIKIIETESMKPKLRVIDYYRIRTINTIHIFSRLACVFSPLSKKNYKIWRISSLLVSIFDAHSNNTESSNHKIVWEVFLVRNLIFLTPSSVTRSHLHNARRKLLKPSIGKIMDFFLLHLISRYINTSFINNEQISR